MDGHRQYIKRCFHCHAIVLPSQIAKFGCCGECGSRRTQIASKLTDEEEARAIADGYVFDDKEWGDAPTPGEPCLWEES